MILDSSAVVSILLRETGHEDLTLKLTETSLVAIGAPTLFETGMVMANAAGSDGRASVVWFLEAFEVEVVPFANFHSQIAIEAFGRYGKGRHPARLNFGDCMTYATALIAQQPLLFVGDDFTRTDLKAA